MKYTAEEIVRDKDFWVLNGQKLLVFERIMRKVMSFSFWRREELVAHCLLASIDIGT